MVVVLRTKPLTMKEVGLWEPGVFPVSQFPVVSGLLTVFTTETEFSTSPGNELVLATLTVAVLE